MLARGSRFPRWVGYLGIVTAVAGLIGMMRNVTGVVAPLAAVNNYLLPLWMIIFGVFLVRHRPDISKSDQSV
jgi:drug/metabolite transporter (DMT)-like permease